MAEQAGAAVVDDPEPRPAVYESITALLRSVVRHAASACMHPVSQCPLVVLRSQLHAMCMLHVASAARHSQVLMAFAPCMVTKCSAGQSI